MTQNVDTSTVTTELANRPEGARPGSSIFDQIRASETALARALPKLGVTPERFARLVTTEIRKNRALAACSAASLLGAMMYAAQLGLEPGPLQRAYLVPYKQECTLIIGYRGMLELARRSGEIKQLEAREICEHDEFTFDLGDTPFVKHSWDYKKPRGDVVAFYGLAVFTNGGKFILPVSLDQIDSRRKRSRANEKGPWSTDFDAMARKTVIRMMEPWLPLTAEVAETFATDGAVRVFNQDAITPDGEIPIDVRELPPGDETDGEAATGGVPPEPQDVPPEAVGAAGEADDGPQAVDGQTTSPVDAAGLDVDPFPPEDFPDQTKPHGYALWAKPDLEATVKDRETLSGVGLSNKTKDQLVAMLRADDAAKGDDFPEPSAPPF